MVDHSSQNADKLLGVLVVTLIFSVMNGTMFNVALPEIGKEFNLVPSEVSWIMTSYMVVYAVGSIVMGKLADKYRLKDLLTYGLLIFALGSLLGLLATEYWVIILGRVIQAAGASVLPATAMIIPVRYFVPEKRGRALGTSAVGLALGNALGPVAAGLITSFGSWRLIFVLSLLPLLTLPFFRKYLDNAKGKAGSIDILGGGLLAVSVAFFLLAITQMQVLLFLSGFATLAFFILRIRKAKEPFIKPILFKNKNFSIGLLLAFMTTAMSFSMTFMTPQFLSVVNGLTPSNIGFVLVPAAIASAIMGRKGGRVADTRGNFALVFIASVFIFLAFSLLSTFIGISAFVIALILIFGNVGQTFMQISMSNTISQTLSKEETGVGMGLLSMINFISGAMAMSVVGKLLDKGSTSLKLNPFVANEATNMYSNIFGVMSLLILLVVMLYRFQFGTGVSTLNMTSKVNKNL
ncbi:TPA: MFS transporter [Bacillus anthracis]|uniref:MFS transporter n=1 Tax=Bacillus anthracis TaxID=1392 RepID=UPI0001DBF55F|nr:MFS transporter [Bacillus cereus]HDR4492924.1 MFS transporter [Bacillus cereus biovar anthracis]ADK03756.1 major facilitator family transporter; possible metal-tetracycline/H+ antiporter [Bacillus cereus biovar anthracis str. CI]HDR6227505.1 MFS transporter [Bacillus cereus biovar anthracis]HDR6233951.1 MFS transporter [Bacillus cereus biovar anthracis]HDR6238009.1 MFS transporter [Bacillus cereus biovar anthracis]